MSGALRRALVETLETQARRAPRRQIDLGRSWYEHADDTLEGFLRNRRGPMAMGAQSVDPRLADDFPYLMGIGAAGLGVGLPAFGNRLAFMAQEARDPELVASRQLERDLQTALRLQAARQQGYMSGLELEHERLMRDAQRFGTYEDTWERYGR